MRNENRIKVRAVVASNPVARRYRGDYFVYFIVAWRHEDGSEHNVMCSTRGKLARDCRVNLIRGEAVTLTGELNFRRDYYTIRVQSVARLATPSENVTVGKRIFLQGGYAHLDLEGFAGSSGVDRHGHPTVNLLVNLPGQKRQRRIFTFPVRTSQPITKGSSLSVTAELKPGVPAHKGTFAPAITPTLLSAATPIIRGAQDYETDEERSDRLERYAQHDEAALQADARTLTGDPEDDLPRVMDAEGTPLTS